MAKACKEGCKWCAKGECWTSGQIEKPEGLPERKKGKGKGKGGFGMPSNPQQLMAMMQKMMAGAAGGAKAGANVGASGEMRWKQQLHEALQKNQSTEKPVYNTVEDPPDSKKYVSTVTVGGQDFTGTQGKSKKEAEQAAAKAAVKELYPDHFKKANQMGGMSNAMAMMQQMMGGGQKRKAEEVEAPEKNAKTKLMNAVQLLITKNLGRTLQKGDLTWEMQDFDENGKKSYQATVTISEGSKQYNGQVCESKKAAEDSAASIAYDNMADILGPLEEEHREKKRKKNEESLAALKKRTEEKKALKKAEALALTA